MSPDQSPKRNLSDSGVNSYNSDYVLMFTGLTGPYFRWEPVNDTVMGGRSKATVTNLSIEDLYIHGNLSLENNGGFASARTRCRLNLSGFNGFRLRVAGDGKKYCFRIKTLTQGELHHFSYEACFDTSQSLSSSSQNYKESLSQRNKNTGSSALDLSDDFWEPVDLPFELFTPVFRGRNVPDAPPLDPTDIGEVAVMIKDRQQGPFELMINEIAAFREEQSGEQKWMQEALAAADQSGTPYGAVIIDADDGPVSIAANRVKSENDATAHAEIRAIRQAGDKRNNASLSGCRLFTTVEPCPMCMSAAIWAGLSEIYYGATIPDVKAAGGNQIDLRAKNMACRTSNPPKLFEGLSRDECKKRIQTLYHN